MFRFLKKRFSKENRSAKAAGINTDSSALFHLKYLKLSDTRKARKPKNAMVGFSKDGQYIIINGEREPYNTAFLNNEGMSRDYLYQKISTPDYVFWVKPEDCDKFISAAASANSHSNTTPR